MVAVFILASFGLLAYQGLVAKDLEEKNVIRALLILAGLVLALLKTGRCPRVTNKKAVYEKAYPEYIQNVFSADKKLETLFFRAVDDYNQNNPSAGVKKLEALRKECHSTMDLYAVTVFTALSLAAICCALLGQQERYEDYYRRAVTAGYDGSKIKNTIRSLRTDL